MLRLLSSTERLNNNNLCGTDDSFCYPIARPWDVVMYYRLPMAATWVLQTVAIYDSTHSTLLAILNGPSDVAQYFSYIIAEDSNGDNFIVMRQIQPFYNMGGVVSPEITCYAMDIYVIPNGTYSYHLYSEPVCCMEEYCMNHYVINAPIADVSLLAVGIECDGVTTAYLYNELPTGMWIEYTGPFIDLFIPENCTLVLCTVNAVPTAFSDSVTCFGVSTCKDHVKINGNGQMRYDCNGRYFGAIEYDSVQLENLPQSLIVSGDDYRLSSELLAMNIHWGKIRQLDNKMTPSRVKNSCFISHAEVVSRYRIESNTAVPPWFQSEVNNVSSMQQVILSGSSPLLDDYDEYITLVQSAEYGWREKKYSQYAYPSLIYETCTCFKDFTC